MATDEVIAQSLFCWTLAQLSLKQLILIHQLSDMVGNSSPVLEWFTSLWVTAGNFGLMWLHFHMAFYKDPV